MLMTNLGLLSNVATLAITAMLLWVAHRSDRRLHELTRATHELATVAGDMRHQQEAREDRLSEECIEAWARFLEYCNNLTCGAYLTPTRARDGYRLLRDKEALPYKSLLYRETHKQLRVLLDCYNEHSGKRLPSSYEFNSRPANNVLHLPNTQNDDDREVRSRLGGQYNNAEYRYLIDEARDRLEVRRQAREGR